MKKADATGVAWLRGECPYEVDGLGTQEGGINEEGMEAWAERGGIVERHRE